MHDWQCGIGNGCDLFIFFHRSFGFCFDDVRAIPTLIYYGFEILCGILSVGIYFIIGCGIALGSGFTTCATVGVAFWVWQPLFGANPAIVAGAVISGALFGDKMSPFIQILTSIAASLRWR